MRDYGRNQVWTAIPPIYRPTGDAAVPGRVLAAFDGPVEVELELGMTTRYAPPLREVERQAVAA